MLKHLRYSGRVQGVGFRFTAQQIAVRQGINGYIRNLPDGGVELVADGDAQAVERCISALESAMRGNIHDVQTLPPPAETGFDCFEIRF